MKRGKNFYWSIVEGIKYNKLLTSISKELNITKQSLNYYLPRLYESGFITKDEEKRWIYLRDYDEKRVKKSTRVGSNHLESVKNKKEVRGHAIQIKLLLPKDYRNWEKRRKIFNYIGLSWKPHFIGEMERGEISEMEGIKIHFYNKTIVFNLDEKDFKEDTARISQQQAIITFLRIVKKLERTFYNSPLSHYGKYKFKITRQHYSLIKNALASQYISEKKKLYVYTGKGLWLLIDNSFNLEELETVHPETAVEDNEKVQTHFNIIKNTPIEVIKEMSPENLRDQFLNIREVFPVMEEYNRNLKLHIQVQEEQLKTQKETQQTLKLIGESLKK